MPEPTTPRPLDAAGVIGAVICCAIWGGNAVAAKYCIADGALPPIGGAALRFAISLPVVAFVCMQGKARLWPDFRPGNGWLLLLHGALTAVQIGTFNWGTSLSEAGRSSIFINIHSLIVAPLAWMFLGEHLGTRGLVGLASAALGVGIILAKQLWLGGGLLGDCVVLVSAVVFASQTIAQKLTFPRIPARTLLFSQSIVALVLSAIYSILFEGASSYHFTPDAVWGVVYQGLFSSGICFSVWLILLSRYPASRLATIAFLTPFFGISLGSLMRGEPLTWQLAIGGVLVGLGIYLVASGKEEGAVEPTPDDGLAAPAEAAVLE
jgi:drug/metabolite transporter (DMT)-like permease